MRSQKEYKTTKYKCRLHKETNGSFQLLSPILSFLPPSSATSDSPSAETDEGLLYKGLLDEIPFADGLIDEGTV